MAGLRQAAQRGQPIHGECGGYMVLGQALIDSDGVSHAMAGLLPTVNSMAQPRRHLGYRRARLLADTPWGQADQMFCGHEFHYAVEVDRQGPGLFHTGTAAGSEPQIAGCQAGPVTGSFLHLIAPRPGAE